MGFMTNRAVVDGDARRDYASYYSAAVFLIISILITMREIILHLFHWNNPEFQTYYIKVLLLVPWFGIFSFCSLRFDEGEAYFEAAKNGYEAFTAYTYGHMLVALLGGKEAAIEKLRTKEPLNHRCCCAPFCKKWPMDETFLERFQWALQWLIYAKLGNAVVIIITEPLRQYDNLQFAFNMYSLMTIFIVYFTINGMYTMIMFYTAVKDDLIEPKDWNPTAKLWSFKGILLYGRLVGIVIAILVSTGAIKSSRGWGDEHVSLFLQNWCNCLLMVFISILNMYAYSYTDFLEPDKGNEKEEATVGSNEGIEDIVEQDEVNEEKVDVETTADKDV